MLQIYALENTDGRLYPTSYCIISENPCLLHTESYCTVLYAGTLTAGAEPEHSENLTPERDENLKMKLDAARRGIQRSIWICSTASGVFVAGSLVENVPLFPLKVESLKIRNADKGVVESKVEGTASASRLEVTVVTSTDPIVLL